MVDLAWDKCSATVLIAQHREPERSVMWAMASFASAGATHMERADSPRALLLRHAFGLADVVADTWVDGDDRLAVAVVTRDRVTLRMGAEGLPVFLCDVGAGQLDVVTLVAGHDGRWCRRELDAIGWASPLAPRHGPT